MKKRAIASLTAVVLALSIVGAGFSAWHFNISDKKESSVKVDVDDIAENYSFTEASKKRNVSKEYTIYLFPSTLYLNDYIAYLDGASNIKPEDLYGYVQAKTDADGNVLYDGDKVSGYDTVYSNVATSTVGGSAFSDIYASADCGGDGGYLNSVINGALGYNDLYLTTNATVRAGYEQVYTNYYASSSSSQDSRDFWQGSLNYLDESGQTQQTDKINIGSYVGDGEVKYRANQFRQRKFLFRNQHRYDRFGAWRSLEYGEGRYLPLKITVGADFAYSDFADLALSTLTSMPNGASGSNDYNLTFTHWSYIDTKTPDSMRGTDYTLPYYASSTNTQATGTLTEGQLRVRNAYLGYMLEQYFDIMQDFEKYSDEYGVIRLFPTFSGGSNKVQSSEFISGDWNEGLDRGTGDSVYIYTVGSDGNSGTSTTMDIGDPLRDFRLHSTMTTQTVSYYNNETGSTSSAGAETESIRCSMYANLNINSIDKLEIWLQPKGGATTSWESDELILYDIPKSVIDEIIDAYGDGLYNLYFFMGNFGFNNRPAPMKSISNIVEYARTSDDIFPSLTGKNLISLESMGVTQLSDYGLSAHTPNVYDNMSIVNGSTINGNEVKWPKTGVQNSVDNKWSQFLGAKGIGGNGSASSKEYYRPVMLAIEKVRDARVIMNMDVDENAVKGDGKNDVQKFWDSYERTGVSFRMLNEEIYVSDIGATSIDITDDPLNAQYPYSYFLSGIDFTNSATDYFQIRFQKRYRADLPFVGTDGTAGIDTAGTGGLAPATNIIYNPNDDGTFDEDRRFINAFGAGGYFDAISANMTGYISESASTQVFFKLQNEEMRGIYDLIIMYVPYEYWSVTNEVSEGVTTTRIHYNLSEAEADKTATGGELYTHKPGFYVYAYRHTNIFLKIVEKDPTVYVESDGAQFIKHDDYSNNRLLFQSVFQLGVKLDISHQTQVVGTGTSDIQLGDGYTVPGTNATLAQCVNGYVKAYLEKNPADIDKIVLRDHVTKGIVGYYQKVSDGTADPDNSITVGEETYQLVLEELVVRKNYVFYISTVN